MPRTKVFVQNLVEFDEAMLNQPIEIGTRFQNIRNMDGFIKVVGIDGDDVQVLVTDRKRKQFDLPKTMMRKAVLECMNFYGFTVDAPIETIDPIEADEDDDFDDYDDEFDPSHLSDHELLAMKHDISADELHNVIMSTNTADDDYYNPEHPDFMSNSDPSETSDDDDGGDDEGDDDEGDDEPPTTLSDLDAAIRSAFDPDKDSQRVGGTVDNDIASILFTTMATLKITKNEALSMAISMLATADKASLKKALSNVYLTRINTAFKD